MAGYAKAKLWVSSTCHDMDIFVSLRIIDEYDREVDYAGPVTIGMSTKNFPLAKGWLKVFAPEGGRGTIDRIHCEAHAPRGGLRAADTRRDRARGN